MRTIYLDNSATTPLCGEAKKAMEDAMEVYGNPSSLHPLGQDSFRLLEESRKTVAGTLGIRNPKPGQIIFTACGSEADNLALFGTARAKPRRRGGRIITTAGEHPAIDNCLVALEREGYEIVRIPTVGGVLDWEAYENALNEKTFLVTMMTVNNETGAAYDIARAFRMAKAKNPDVVTHTDAVQGYLKVPLNPEKIGADLVTLSGHKIHAPKGVGALCVSEDALRRKDLVPVLLGGGQEAGFRSGTENLIGIAAFAAAAKAGFANLSEEIRHLTDLRDYAEEKLTPLNLRLDIPKGERAPHILHLTLPDIRSETMLHQLSRSGICVSSGSACSSHSKKLSAALAAYGMPENEIDCGLRLSFGRENTREDVDALAQALAEGIETLVRIHR